MSLIMLAGRITITTGVNDVIIYREGGGDLTATITAGDYYLLGDGSSLDLLKAVTDALTAGAGALTYSGTTTFQIDPADRHSYVSITAGGNFSLRFASASTTFDPALLGFSATNTASDPQSISDLPCAAVWIGNDHARELEPQSSRVATVQRTQSGAVRGVSRSSRMQSWRLGFQFLIEGHVFVERATDGDANALEAFIERFGAGATLGIFETDTSTLGVVTFADEDLVDVVAFSEDTLANFAPTRIAPGTPLYSVDLLMHSEAD